MTIEEDILTLEKMKKRKDRILPGILEVAIIEPWPFIEDEVAVTSGCISGNGELFDAEDFPLGLKMGGVWKVLVTLKDDTQAITTRQGWRNYNIRYLSQPSEPR